MTLRPVSRLMNAAKISLRVLSFVLGASTIVLFRSSPCVAETISVASIKCENKIDPLGVPLKDLRFSWELTSQQIMRK